MFPTYAQKTGRCISCDFVLFNSDESLENNVTDNLTDRRYTFEEQNELVITCICVYIHIYVHINMQAHTHIRGKRRAKFEGGRVSQVM